MNNGLGVTTINKCALIGIFNVGTGNDSLQDYTHV